MKTCNICNVEKPIEEFALRGNGKDKRRANCKICYNSNWKNRVLSGIASRTSPSHNRWRENGTMRKTTFRGNGIDGKYLEYLKNYQNGLCYWFKIPIDFTLKDKLRRPSLDRLDNDKGYEIGNVVLTTVFANTGRRDANLVEMKNFIENYLSV